MGDIFRGKRVGIGLMVIVVTLAIVSCFVLPDNVIVQINAAAQPSNVMPKAWATIIPVALGALGLFVDIFWQNTRKYRGKIILGACILVEVLTLAFNA